MAKWWESLGTTPTKEEWAEARRTAAPDDVIDMAFRIARVRVRREQFENMSGEEKLAFSERVKEELDWIFGY